MPPNTANPVDEIAQAVAGLDLWQPRDWPHRRGDLPLRLDLHSFPLAETSPGRRSVACEHCGRPCLCVHDNVLCWRCKGAFCFDCTGGGDPAQLCMMPMERMLKNGWGKCHVCKEPLRSIALIVVLRRIIEGGGLSINANNPSRPMENKGTSLVREAEDALARGQEAAGRNDREKAISEFTHAINAINYTASASNGARLVLRAKDILLVAHHERALLEGNGALCGAIVAAFPKASVRSGTDDDATWYLSRSAYRSLYYPLPAMAMAGASSGGGGLVGVDLRRLSRDEAFSSPAVKEQFELTGTDSSLFSLLKNNCPHVDGMDGIFDSLSGTWRGIVANLAMMPSLVKLGSHSFQSCFVAQFVRAFPTNLAAKEYVRLIIEKKLIGEEGPPLKATFNPDLTRTLRKMFKEDVEDYHKVHVIKGQAGPLSSISVVFAVGNVSTKIFVQTMGGGEEQMRAACHLVAKAASYLERQLRESRSTNPSRMKEAPHHHPDLTVCAYCGQDAPPKTCSRCKLSKYCSADCQKKHWEMRGPFAHKPFCNGVFLQARRR